MRLYETSKWQKMFCLGMSLLFIPHFITTKTKVSVKDYGTKE